MLAPIALFVYKRVDHARKVVDLLLNNSLASESTLYIFSDGPKSEKDKTEVNNVREFIRTIEGFAHIEIVEAPKNKGLANSIISGVSAVIKEHGKIIVIEDDLLPSPHFLSYMNKVLDHYEDMNKVFSVGAFNFPPDMLKFPADYPHNVYVSYRCFPWGWGTWKDRWKKVDWELKDYNKFIKNKEAQQQFDIAGEDLTIFLRQLRKGKIDSWWIRFAYAHYKNRAYAVNPVISHINNIGFDATATHAHDFRPENDILLATDDINFCDNIDVIPQIAEDIQAIYRYKLIDRLKIYVSKKIGRL